MLVKILGCIWIVLAVLLLVRPQGYKDWLQRQRARIYILLLTLAVGALLINIGLQFQSLPATIVVILGWMSVLKGVLFLNAKLYSKAIDWALTMPILFYRIGACVHIGIGLILLSLR